LSDELVADQVNDQVKKNKLRCLAPMGTDSVI